MKTEICNSQDSKEKIVSFCSIPSKNMKINTNFNNKNLHQSFKTITEIINHPNGDALIIWKNIFDNTPGSTLIKSQDKYAYPCF